MERSKSKVASLATMARGKRIGLDQAQRLLEESEAIELIESLTKKAREERLRRPSPPGFWQIDSDKAKTKTRTK